MKYSRDDALPPTAGNDLSASYGMNRLKGSDCDINPFFEAFKQDDLVCGVNCLTEIKMDSSRAITSTNSNKGSSRKTIYGPWNILILNLNSVQYYIEGSNLGNLFTPKTLMTCKDCITYITNCCIVSNSILQILKF